MELIEDPTLERPEAYPEDEVEIGVTRNAVVARQGGRELGRVSTSTFAEGASVSPNLRHIALNFPGKIEMYALDSGELVTTLELDSGIPVSSWGDDGNLLVLQSLSSLLWLQRWDVSDMTAPQRVWSQPVGRLAFGPVRVSEGRVFLLVDDFALTYSLVCLDLTLGGVLARHDFGSEARGVAPGVVSVTPDHVLTTEGSFRIAVHREPLNPMDSANPGERRGRFP